MDGVSLKEAGKRVDETTCLVDLMTVALSLKKEIPAVELNRMVSMKRRELTINSSISGGYSTIKKMSPIKIKELTMNSNIVINMPDRNGSVLELGSGENGLELTMR